MRICVIGSGLAGATAALTLREGGAEVEVISRAPGASALGGGTLDFAGASPAPGATPARRRSGMWLTPAERAVELLARSPNHPYQLLLEPGREAEQIREAIRRLHEWLGREGLAVVGRSDRSMLVCDTQGVIRVGDGALASVAAGDLQGVEELALVALPGLAAWDAGAVAERLHAESRALLDEGLCVSQVDAAWPESWCEAGRVPARLAALLDDPGALPTLRELLRPVAVPGRLLLFPPVLGLDPKNPVREALAQALGCPVAECAGLPPLHLAGIRLQKAVELALDRAGVTRTRAVATGLQAATTSGGHEIAMCAVDEAWSDENQRPNPTREEAGAEWTRHCDATVLATGRFVGGGLREGPAGLEEPVLGLPLLDARGRCVAGATARALSTPDYEAPQPLYSAGVRVDDHLRALGSDGRPAATRLFAAGELLGGFDPALDRSGHGVALLSGFRAGAEALRAIEAES